MITRLSYHDIDAVVRMHKSQLPGFLSELGESFLRKFYKVSLDIPELFSFVEKRNEQIYGFVTGTSTTNGLYKKIIYRDVLGFGFLFLRYFIVHPGQVFKFAGILAYPGFSDNIPELLTISVDRKYQKKGVGRKLFKMIVGEFKRRAIGKFRVSVYESLPANTFYSRVGCKFEKSFDFLGEKMNYYVYESLSLDAQKKET